MSTTTNRGSIRDARPEDFDLSDPAIRYAEESEREWFFSSFDHDPATCDVCWDYLRDGDEGWLCARCHRRPAEDRLREVAERVANDREAEAWLEANEPGYPHPCCEGPCRHEAERPNGTGGLFTLNLRAEDHVDEDGNPKTVAVAADRVRRLRSRDLVSGEASTQAALERVVRLHDRRAAGGAR